MLVRVFLLRLCCGPAAMTAAQSTRSQGSLSAPMAHSSLSLWGALTMEHTHAGPSAVEERHRDTQNSPSLIRKVS